MKRLLYIEYTKQKHFKAFWILLALHFILMGLVFFSFHPFLEFLNTKDFGLAAMIGVKPTDLPFFDFVDIWQNISWIAGLFKYILAFIVIMSVCNEYSYKTVRQNIIDGFSKKDFLYSKLILVVFLSLVSALFVWLCGLLLGFMYSPVIAAQSIFAHMDFVLAYALELMVSLSFAMFVGVLVKRAGLSIVLFVIYFVAEPIVWFNIELPESILWLQSISPGESISNIIHMPFKKYFLQEVQDYIGLWDIIIASAYLYLYAFFTYKLLKKRDL